MGIFPSRKTLLLLGNTSYGVKIKVLDQSLHQIIYVLQVIIKRRQLMCLTTSDGKPPKLYGRKNKGCKIDKRGYGVGVKPRVYFVYIK